MREKEIERKDSPDASDKSYQKEGAKSSTDKGKKGAAARRERWDKAVESVPIEALLEHLDLKEGEDTVCPFCGAKDSLALDHGEHGFR